MVKERHIFVHGDGTITIDQHILPGLADLDGELSALARLLPRPRLVVHVDQSSHHEVVGALVYAAHRAGFSGDTFGIVRDVE